jgi:hypothetical protein
MRKFLATTAAGLALAAGSIAVATLSPIGTALAQDGTQTAPTTQSQPADGQRDHKHLRRIVARAGIKDAAGVIGIEPQELVTALRGGQSIAQVATAHGVDPQAVIDKLVADASARIDQGVANGKLSAEKAAEIKGKLPERVTKAVNRVFDGSHGKDATPAG